MRNIIRKAQAGFTLVELMIVVAIIGILAALSVQGVRKYMANAKTAEAKNAIGDISKNAVAALERDIPQQGVVAPGQPGVIQRNLCDTASALVPSDPLNIAGKKYQANPDPTANLDYNADRATVWKGFHCLGFEMTNPQSYQYNYDVAGGDKTVKPDGKVVSIQAVGDLNGDALYSTFEMSGTVLTNQLIMSPDPKITNETE